MPLSTPTPPPNAIADSIMQFPCDVPVTTIGIRADGLAQAIADCVQSIIPNFDPSTIEMRPSKQGTYLAVVFTVNVSSKAQLEQLNTALKAHPMVKIVL